LLYKLLYRMNLLYSVKNLLYKILSARRDGTLEA
jgi:hypothetical protein